MFTITIKTNRIHFESFEAPCGEPERDEIRAAWEQAACEVIENAGYDCRIDIGVGHDPAREWYLGYGDRRGIDWFGPAALRPVVRRDVKRVVDEAIEAADKAAQALSDQFVAESETATSEEVE